MQVAPQEQAVAAPPDLSAKQSWRSVKSLIMTGLMVASVAAPFIYFRRKGWLR